MFRQGLFMLNSKRVMRVQNEPQDGTMSQNFRFWRKAFQRKLGHDFTAGIVVPVFEQQSLVHSLSMEEQLFLAKNEINFACYFRVGIDPSEH